MDIRNAIGTHITYIVSIFNGALFTNFYLLLKLEHNVCKIHNNIYNTYNILFCFTGGIVQSLGQ